MPAIAMEDIGSETQVEASREPERSEEVDATPQEARKGGGSAASRYEPSCWALDGKTRQSVA